MAHRLNAETHFQRVINLSRVLMVLTLLLLGVTVLQQSQIREMRAVDCAAYAERVSRITMYDNLMQAWTAEQGIAPRTRQEIVTAYSSQRAAVQRAAAAGSECGK